MSAYIPRHFKPEEFVPPEVFQRLAAANMIWKVWLIMDERILRAADTLRDEFGALTVNNWHTGGSRDECGLRVPGQSHYRETSQHAYGRAIDAVSRSLSGEDMRRVIKAKPDRFPLITRVENGTPHLHVDVGNAFRIAWVNP